MPAYLGDRLFLDDGAFCGEAKAHATVIRSLAGRTRYLYELVSGTTMLNSEPLVSPPNPEGEVGINLSGPPWGSALIHPIAWIGGRKDPGTTVMAGPRPLTRDGIPALQSWSLGPWIVKSRRYQPLGSASDGGDKAPYSRARLHFRGWASSGTVAGAVSVWSGRKTESNERTGTISYSSTTEAITSSSTVWIDLDPSGKTKVWITIGNTDATDTLHITSLMAYQAVKRSH